MKAMLVFACLVVFATAKSLSDTKAQFQHFKDKYGKSYKNALEEGYRFKVFADNVKTITEHNELHQQGKVSFSLGMNQYADLTTEEFVANYVGVPKPRNFQPKVFHSAVGDVPDSIDWRDEGYVGPVTDQGQCGAAWTFATTGALEGQNFAATGTFVKLSEQNLLDCTYNVSMGCSGGGNVDDGFQYVIDNGGIDTEDGYPTVPDGKCHYDPAAKGGTASSYVDVASKDENALKEATGTIGPIAAYIDASQVSFQLYVSGVYYEPLCSSNILDHTVLIVGYGSDAGDDYWIARNTWGVNWGEQGYIRMSRNKDNNCGIATQASYPLV